MPRSQIDEYTAYVARYGARGLAYIKVNERAKGRDGLQSPIVKFLDEAAVQGILERTGAVDGDLVFFGADRAKVVNDALGALRLKVGEDLKLATERLAAAVGSRFPDVRVRRGGEALGRRCIIRSPRRKNPDAAALKANPGRRARAGLRHGAQRQRSRRRFGAYPPPGIAVGGVRAARDRRR